jgi:dTDP-4-dehydrorhamnose reductase
MLDLMKRRVALRVVSDQIARPTYCPDLVDAILTLVGIIGESPAAAGSYHYANTGSTSWYGLACEILEQARELQLGVVTERIDPIATGDLPRPAPRPAYSVLSTTRIERALGVAPPSWQSGVSRFLAEVAG